MKDKPKATLELTRLSNDELSDAQDSSEGPHDTTDDPDELSPIKAGEDSYTCGPIHNSGQHKDPSYSFCSIEDTSVDIEAPM